METNTSYTDIKYTPNRDNSSIQSTTSDNTDLIVQEVARIGIANLTLLETGAEGKILGNGEFAIKAFHPKQIRGVKLNYRDAILQNLRGIPGVLQIKGFILKEPKSEKPTFVENLVDAHLQHQMLGIATFFVPNSRDLFYYRINISGDLPFKQIRSIAKQILGALSYLHAQKIVHRDIKLENILIDDLEKTTLIDFGFACYCTKGAQTICGTMGFMAPELLDQKTSYYSEKVDIWSFSILLYILYFNESTNTETICKTLKDRGTIFSEDSCQLNQEQRDFNNLLTSMFSMRPRNRPSAKKALEDPFFEHS